MNLSKVTSQIAIGIMAFGAVSVSAASLRINGSTTVNPVAAEAAEILRAEKKADITVDTQGGSSGGIAGVGDSSIDIGMSSKPIAQDDRAKYPKVNFVETKIGHDAVAMVVSADVYNGGVHFLTKSQIKDIYEGRITNWKQVGGRNERIVFLNKEPGRGTWEVFAKYLYGDPKTAPEVNHPEVGGNEETRSKVISTRGSMSQLSSAWAENNPKIKALGLKLDSGQVVTPTAANIANGSYPMSRPLFFITNGSPTGEARNFIDFVLTPRGQELVKKHGYLRLSDLSRPAKEAAQPIAKPAAKVVPRKTGR
ncbi:MAG TPA: phosphate ABC transporter substrate-binding protein [Thermoanaerobaculia bacterium]|nr:phosphate ABC transporter substrate-binding protein [Thermoanaerobaculia bacterium]